MQNKNHRKALWIFALTMSVVILMGSTSFSLPTQDPTILGSGMISYAPKIEVTVQANNVIGSNNMSLGFMLDWERWMDFISKSSWRDLAQNANFKLIRVFDFRPTTPRLMPCTYWNELTKTGTWNWTNVDTLTQKIFEIGAEPLFCLGYARDNIQNYIPPGMAVDPITELPNPNSYALYASEWVRHFKTLGQPVRYYQVMNEPYSYFGWNAANATRLANFVVLWNATAKAMRQQNSNIMLSQDSITMRNVFDYWLTHGEDVDFLDFHKYDADTINQYDDLTMLSRAENRQFETSSTFYGVEDARQKWYNARHKWLPAINSESNFNSAWQTGTDPKIQQIVGATWLALVLRTGILKGLSYNIYFEFFSSKSMQEAKGTGWGFGMTNKDNGQPWYPYYVNKLIGENLSVGDTLIASDTSSDDVRSLVWIHNNLRNILLICKADAPRMIAINGISSRFHVSWIDSTTPAQAPSIQETTIDYNKPFSVNGYNIAILQEIKSS